MQIFLSYVWGNVAIADAIDNDFKILLNTHKNFADAHNNYANILIEHFADYQAAKKHFEEAIERDPKFSIAGFNFFYGNENDDNGLENPTQTPSSMGNVVAGMNDVGATSYTYDEIGRLVKESIPAQNMSLIITWTPYDKVESVLRYNSGGTLITGHYYLYDGMGNQVGDRTTTGDETIHVFDGHNTQVAVYHIQSPTGPGQDIMGISERYIYGSDRLGTLKGSSVIGTFSPLGVFSWVWGAAQREYEIHDHLGNVRATISAIAPGTNHIATLLNYYNYYAFGSYEPYRCFEPNGEYPFGFNGQEKKDDYTVPGGSYDYGMRDYDARIGRFIMIDPLFYSYPYNSTYAYTENSPIIGVDKDGLELLPINSSMYMMKVYGGNTTLQPSNSLTVEVKRENIPNRLLDSKGNIKYFLGPPVGINGRDYTGQYLDDRPGIPEYDFGDPDPVHTPSSKGDVSGTVSQEKYEGADGAGNAVGMLKYFVGNMYNSGIRDAGNVEVQKRNAFYTATNLATNYSENLPSQFRNGKGKADLINLLTDGTVPPINMNDSKEVLRAQSAYNISLIESGLSIMHSENIAVQSAVTDLYEKVISINLKAGGDGGAFYNSVHQIYNKVIDFIKVEVGQHWTTVGADAKKVK